MRQSGYLSPSITLWKKLLVTSKIAQSIHFIITVRTGHFAPLHTVGLVMFRCRYRTPTAHFSEHAPYDDHWLTYVIRNRITIFRSCTILKKETNTSVMLELIQCFHSPLPRLKCKNDALHGPMSHILMESVI